MLTRIIAYYNDPARNGEEAMNEEGGAYLLRLDKKRLSRMERVGICETLISQDLYKEAYGMIREFGEEGLRIKRLLKLCTKLISQNLAEADDLLLHMARRILPVRKRRRRDPGLSVQILQRCQQRYVPDPGTGGPGAYRNLCIWRTAPGPASVHRKR